MNNSTIKTYAQVTSEQPDWLSYVKIHGMTNDKSIISKLDLI